MADSGEQLRAGSSDLQRLDNLLLVAQFALEVRISSPLKKFVPILFQWKYIGGFGAGVGQAWMGEDTSQ